MGNQNIKNTPPYCGRDLADLHLVMWPVRWTVQSRAYGSHRLPESAAVKMSVYGLLFTDVALRQISSWWENPIPAPMGQLTFCHVMAGIYVGCD